jgi:hypothetical protein
MGKRAEIKYGRGPSSSLSFEAKAGERERRGTRRPSLLPLQDVPRESGVVVDLAYGDAGLRRERWSKCACEGARLGGC